MEKPLDYGPLRAAMKHQKIKQTDLARALGISPKHLNQVLLGRCTPNVTLLIRIADQMGMEWRLTYQSTRD